MKDREDNNQKNDLILIRDAAKLTPYGAEYLGLLARRGRFFSKKIGKNWYTTEKAVKDYLNYQVGREFQKRKETKSGSTHPLEIRAASFQNNLSGLENTNPISGEQHFQQNINEDRISKTVSENLNSYINQEIRPLLVHKEKTFRQRIQYACTRFIRSPWHIFFLLCLLAFFLVFPMRFIFGQIGNTFFEIHEYLKNAETLMGHTAGINANQVLLLGTDPKIRTLFL